MKKMIEGIYEWVRVMIRELQACIKNNYSGDSGLLILPHCLFMNFAKQLSRWIHLRNVR